MKLYNFGITVVNPNNDDVYQVIRHFDKGILVNDNGVVVREVSLRNMSHINDYEIDILMGGSWKTENIPITEIFKFGDIFSRFGDYYMIVQPLDNHVCLVNAVTGNRWQDKIIQVHDSYRIKQHELANAIDDWHKFKHEPHLTVTVGEINK